MFVGCGLHRALFNLCTIDAVTEIFVTVAVISTSPQYMNASIYITSCYALLVAFISSIVCIFAPYCGRCALIYSIVWCADSSRSSVFRWRMGVSDIQ